MLCLPILNSLFTATHLKPFLLYTLINWRAIQKNKMWFTKILDGNAYLYLSQRERYWFKLKYLMTPPHVSLSTGLKKFPHPHLLIMYLICHNNHIRYN